MTHQMIRRFQLAGELIETKMPQVRSSAISMVANMMRDTGYVPVLDLDPVWHTFYLGDDRYEYTLTMHAVFVGREKAWHYAGMTDGKLIPNTPKPK